MKTPVWTYKAIADNQTGKHVDHFNYAKGQVIKDEALRFSHKLAQALFKQGINVYAKPGAQTHKIGLVTGIVEEADAPFINSPMIPVMMMKQRQGLIKDLQLFRENDPLGRHMRYAVVTAGDRVKMADLESTILQLVERVRRWASDVARPYGVEPIVRAIEFPYDPLTKTFHVHCNLIYLPTKGLTSKAWASFLTDSRGAFQAHWQDQGLIRDIEEAVKYCLKGEDLALLEREGGRVLANWFQAVKGRRLVQTFKRFGAWRAEVRAQRLRPYSLLLSDGSKALVFAQKPDPVDNPEIDEPRKFSVLAVTLPQASLSPYKEPCAIVRGYDPELFKNDAYLQRSIKLANEQWTANGGPDIDEARRAAFNVHNSALTAEIQNRQARRQAKPPPKINPKRTRSDARSIPQDPGFGFETPDPFENWFSEREFWGTIAYEGHDGPRTFEEFSADHRRDIWIDARASEFDCGGYL